MIIDHRTYTLYPGKIGSFLEAYQNGGWPIQQRILGDCIGWYTSMDIGQLNQVVHLWRYRDLADRAARRAQMNADADWQAYLQVAMPFIQHMENKILTAAPFFDAN